MELSGEILDFFENEPYHQFATASLNGQPNISNIGAKYVREDGAIIIIDNFMKKTKDNILANPKAAILVRREKMSYQIRGVCKYVDQGSEYEEARKWMKSKGEKYPAKGAVIFTTESVYDSSTKPTAGEKVA